MWTLDAEVAALQLTIAGADEMIGSRTIPRLSVWQQNIQTV
jgi:hypothetical protein